jgi:hypothetical protein
VVIGKALRRPSQRRKIGRASGGSSALAYSPRSEKQQQNYSDPDRRRQIRSRKTACSGKCEAIAARFFRMETPPFA